MHQPRQRAEGNAAASARRRLQGVIVTNIRDFITTGEKLLAQALRAWAEQLLSPAHREQQRLIAQERRIRYLAHIEAGFTEAQALELCKS